MTRNTEIFEFTADRDIVDSLKIEASILAPKQEIMIKSLAQRISEIMAQNYGSYIPYTTLAKIKGIEENVLVLNTYALQTFYNDWGVKKEETDEQKTTNEQVQGVTFTEGNVIALHDPYASWSTLPDEIQNYFIAKCGSEEKAKDIVTQVSLTQVTLHEIIHQYHDWSLPEPFRECGSVYYERKVCKNLLLPFYLAEDLENQRIDFYSSLVREYGNATHRIFFGSWIDPRERTSILSRLNQKEVERLFPDGRNLAN